MVAREGAGGQNELASRLAEAQRSAAIRRYESYRKLRDGLDAHWKLLEPALRELTPATDFSAVGAAVARIGAAEPAKLDDEMAAFHKTYAEPLQEVFARAEAKWWAQAGGERVLPRPATSDALDLAWFGRAHWPPRILLPQCELNVYGPPYIHGLDPEPPHWGEPDATITEEGYFNLSAGGTALEWPHAGGVCLHRFRVREDDSLVSLTAHVTVTGLNVMVAGVGYAHAWTSLTLTVQPQLEDPWSGRNLLARERYEPANLAVEVGGDRQRLPAGADQVFEFNLFFNRTPGTHTAFQAVLEASVDCTLAGFTTASAQMEARLEPITVHSCIE